MGILGRLRTSDYLVPAAVVALVAYLALVPSGYLVERAFFDDGALTLEHFRDAYGAQGLVSMAANSIWFAAGSSAIAIVGGAGLAFLVVRTDLPFRRVAFGLALVPLIVPGILYAVAWILLASPRSGALADVLPGEPDIFGMGGMIFVEGLHLAPLVFLLMAAAFSSADPALEEAALMSGARRTSVIRRVTLPLARPALYAALLILVVRALESFEVPALLGMPAGTYVFTSRIFEALDDFPADIDEAAALSVSLLVLTAAGVFAYARLSRRPGRFATVSGRGRTPARMELGRWRAPLAAVAGAYLLVASVLPLLILLYASTQPFYTAPTADSLSRASLTHYGALLDDATTVEAFKNSLILGIGTATALTLAMAVVAWVVVRTKGRGRTLLDGLVSLPLAIPGLVIGVALLVLYLRSPLPIYGTLWILFIAYFTRFMPYAMRYGVAAMQQVSGEVEEAARVSGAGAMQTLRRVTLPLVLPGLAAGWLYVLIVSMRELASSLLLYSPGTEVIPVRIFTLYEDGEFAELAALGLVLVVLITVLAGIAYRLGARAQA